jgi:aspartokinase/homoserine dehydrogenase 1
MKVLKFGGTSIADEKAIRQVLHILKTETATEDQIAVVFSALGGVTDVLVRLQEAAIAGHRDESLRMLREIEDRHIALCKTLLAPKDQGQPIAALKVLLNELEDWVVGVSVLQELTRKSSDRILAAGEQCSALVLHAFLTAELGEVACLDPM